MTISDASGSAGPAGTMPGRPERRVVIVDDHELLRAGTRRILEEADGFSVVGEAEDGEAALSVVDRLLPDVVLMDIRLPFMNGLEVARRIVAGHPGITVLILSAYDDEDYVRAALAAGVSGYLLKTTPSQELIRAISSACGGTTVLDKAVSARLLGGGPAAPEQASPLTIRELDVVRLAARGLANKAIGQHLGISPRTVEGHLNHVFEKLGTTSRTELVHYALTNGLLVGDDATLGDAVP
jgi:DNA-binding NarL/FixJ family response regulator